MNTSTDFISEYCDRSIRIVLTKPDTVKDVYTISPSTVDRVFNVQFYTDYTKKYPTKKVTPDRFCFPHKLARDYLQTILDLLHHSSEVYSSVQIQIPGFPSIQTPLTNWADVIPLIQNAISFYM